METDEHFRARLHYLGIEPGDAGTLELCGIRILNGDEYACYLGWSSARRLLSLRDNLTNLYTARRDTDPGDEEGLPF